MKTTSKKPAAKKTSSSKKPERGTVAWLIVELQKFPGDMYVLHGDHDSKYYKGSTVEVLPIKEGEIDEKRGENIVCITAY
jgi:hypothetical protein